MNKKEVMEETNPESFESAMEQLETLVSKMESGDLSLEKSLEAFEKGVHLTRFCQEQLQKAELKIQELNSKGDIIEIDQENEPLFHAPKNGPFFGNRAADLDRHLHLCHHLDANQNGTDKADQVDLFLFLLLRHDTMAET